MEKSRVWLWLTLMAFIVVLVFGTPNANATAVLELSDGATTITVVDQGAGDLGSSVGSITYVGPIGSGVWSSFQVEAGITKPITGTSQSPNMDLSIQGNRSSGAGTLTIKFGDTDFTNSGSGISFQTAYGGITSGTVGIKEYYSDSNTTLGLDSLLFNIGSINGTFSGSATAGAVPGSLYSLTQVVTITHAGAGTTGGDFALVAVPEPGTLLLLGSGLLGLVGVGRKKFRR